MTAYIVLFGWPVVVFILFSRMPPARAILWSVIGGYLLLPTRTFINLPLLPSLDKAFVPSAAAVLAVLIWSAAVRSRAMKSAPMTATERGYQDALPHWIPETWLPRALLALMIFGLFMTATTNSDTQVFGPRVLPGLRLYDAFSMSMIALTMLLPFFLARRFLASPEAHKEVLIALCIAGVLYSFLAMIEVRLSPQLSRWVYGYHPGGFLTVFRGGGWRPTVFLVNGLFVGLFFAMAAIAAVGCMRAIDRKYMWMAGWLVVTLVLVKSLGALLITLMILPVVLLCTTRVQLQVAAVVILCFLSYPALRSADVIPFDRIVSVTERIDEGRAGSFVFRLENEDILLEKASQRPLFGWGGWSRGRVFDDSGRDLSVTDGLWIIELGATGWAGYITQFGLMTFGALTLAIRRRKYDVAPQTAVLCLLLAANIIDFVPNAGMTPITWLLAGALAGRLEWKSSPAEAPATAAPPDDPGSPVYPYARPRPAHGNSVRPAQSTYSRTPKRQDK